MRRCVFSTLPPPSQLCTLSLHDALPISGAGSGKPQSATATAFGEHCVRLAVPDALPPRQGRRRWWLKRVRSEEHTSELQSLRHLVCRLLLEKKKGGDHHNHEAATDPDVA